MWGGGLFCFVLVSFFTAAFCEQLPRPCSESNAACEYYAFSKLQNYSVVHFYSGNLLGPIMIREPGLHL